MSDLKDLVELLSIDVSELRAFLGDPEAWIDLHACDLPKEGRAELRMISMDASAFVEKRCAEALTHSPESRFSAGQPIERRRFCLTATSALLAGLFTMLAPRTSIAQGGGNNLASTDSAPVCDNNCTNMSDCNDGPGCIDNNCNNLAGCKDEANCRDDSCTNESTLGCTDETDCLDYYCLNNSPEVGCGDDRNCVDNFCLDQNVCHDSATCEYKEEQEQDPI